MLFSPGEKDGQKMSGLRFFCFLIALPALAALGHDGYIYYVSVYEKNENLPFRLSDLGYLWQTYSFDTFDDVRKTLQPEIWKMWIDPVLRQSALVVTGGFAAVIYAILTVLWLFGLWPFEKASQYSRGKFSLPGERSNKPMKYKRK